MARLGTLLGSLLAEMTYARMQADLEAVKLAELYRGDSLMNGLPIPRFRLPEVTVDVPVAISRLDDGRPAGFAPPDRPVIAAAIDDAVLAIGVTLAGPERDRLVDELRGRIGRMWTRGEPVERTVQLVRRISRDAADALPVPPAEGENEVRPVEVARIRKQFTAAFERRLNASVLGAAGSGPQVVTVVGTGELREIGDPSLLTRLSLTIREDGFELVSVDRDDGTSDERLVPE